MFNIRLEFEKSWKHFASGAIVQVEDEQRFGHNGWDAAAGRLLCVLCYRSRSTRHTDFCREERATRPVQHSAIDVARGNLS